MDFAFGGPKSVVLSGGGSYSRPLAASCTYYYTIQNNI
jgi:hypothetical protein